MFRISLKPLGKRKTGILKKFWSDPCELPDFIPIPRMVKYQMQFQNWVNSIFQNGKWEHEVTDAIGNIHGSLFIDIGANLGFYVNLLQENFEQTIAVEPHPALFAYISKHHPRNCKVIQRAVSNRRSVIKFYLAEKENLGSSTTLPTWLTSRHEDARGWIRVQADTLDNILLGRTADLVKVDVEGAEWQVIEGAKESMSHIIRWVIEVHDITKKKRFERLMASYGYRNRWLDAHHLYSEKQHLKN
jgi:FkbM family methyltransferase